MNSEEKILEILTKMQTQQEQMQTQMGQMQTQMGQMLTRQDRMEEQLGQVQIQQEQVLTRLSRMETRQDRLEGRQDRTEERMRQAQQDLQRVRLYLELDVEKRFKVINEGIDTILETLVPEKRMEKAEDDIVVLKVAVKALARDVAELKKAE